jgi:predicted amidohydrolase YtcJ
MFQRLSGLYASAFLATASLAICPAPLALADGSVNEQMTKALEKEPTSREPAPATIFVAREVITMEPGNPSGDAVAVSGKRIVAAGKLEDLKKALGDRPYTVDETFKSKIVMPGFIDQHLHPILGALTLAVEVIAPEDWNLPGRTFKAANSQEDYRSRLKAAETNLKTPDEWLLTWGYQSLWHGDAN